MVSNVAMTQFTSSAVVVYLMQKLKNAKWFPLIQEGKTILNRSISVGSAALIALGVNYTWNPQNRGLLITIPTLSVAAVGFWHWLNQYALNEMLYRATVSKAAPTNGNPPTAPASTVIPKTPRGVI
jgi:hypothetical protein